MNTNTEVHSRYRKSYSSKALLMFKVTLSISYSGQTPTRAQQQNGKMVWYKLQIVESIKEGFAESKN